ncbi:tyrosine-protein phosphatase [Thalassotalea atypica]|uniref:tyrosine-protein phosphatase n=1 Tax=Thalassotalea atypica TaxID=2054316 RepID=UPI0025725CF5|nr:CpsB/CapC family capsule biosynthesis tyrosine phosphatase [Thalassotalea atypica]
MIDLHCHILPNIDDGAVDLTESIALIDAAIANGITHMVCTPHIQLGRFDNTMRQISASFDDLQSVVNERGMAIQLAFAAEVRICPEIMLLAKQNTLPFIGHWNEYQVLLLELPHSHIPAGTEQLIKWLKNENILPMIAHPERNRDILADYTKFNQLERAGCLFQITASSLCGDFGAEPQKLAEYLLKKNFVDIIATDTHNIKRRPPKLREGKTLAAKIVGEARAQELVYKTPLKISANKFF